MFARTIQGWDTWGGRCQVPRHRHNRAYAALILAGSYEESGSFGRYRVRAGQVLLHRRFDAHLDRFAGCGARILNLLLDDEPRFGLGLVTDPDAIVRLSETDADAAVRALTAQVRPLAPADSDWPDLLARALRDDPQLRLDEWSECHELAPATLSRGFARVFGTSPAAFRAEARALRALNLMTVTAGPLAAIAADAGFADQAHMTRAIRALTGLPPGRWRRSN